MSTLKLINSQKDSFTCLTCRVAFKDLELQKYHYKTDWHRYNLKRKIAEFPPVTEDEFKDRLQIHQKKDESEDHNVYCTVCHKSFGNQKALENHLNSKKHKDKEKTTKNEDKEMVFNESNLKSPVNKMETNDSDSEVDELDSDEWESDVENPIDNNDCIFCLHHSRNFIKNLEHMTVTHSFFIPDIEYCVDVLGLLRYLGEKISSGFMCLWCNEKGRTFYTAESARQHMSDKGHCKMIHEGIALAEYADFYDYSSSYPDADQEDIDSNQEVSMTEIDGSDYQLVLPSGVTIGHRSLMRYYKQSLNPNRAIVPSKNTTKLHKVLATYRSLGWTETQQVAAAKKARDIHYMKRMQAKYNTKMGMRNNTILQKHFRRQVQF